MNYSLTIQENITENITNVNVNKDIDFVSPAEPIFRLVYLILVSLGTVAGNLLVLLAVLRFKSLRRATNVMLGSLALADLLVGTVTVPLYILWTLNPGVFDRSTFMCGLVLLSCLLVVTASQISLLILSVEQFFAVCRPFQHRDFLIRHTWLHAASVIGTWTVSLLTTSLSFFAFNTSAETCSYYGAFDKNFLFIASIAGVIMPFFLIIFLNVKVLCVVKDHDKRRKSFCNERFSNSNSSRLASSGSYKSSRSECISESFKEDVPSVSDRHIKATPYAENVKYTFRQERAFKKEDYNFGRSEPDVHNRSRWDSCIQDLLRPLFQTCCMSETANVSIEKDNKKESTSDREFSEEDVFVIESRRDTCEQVLQFSKLEVDPNGPEHVGRLATKSFEASDIQWDQLTRRLSDAPTPNSPIAHGITKRSQATDSPYGNPIFKRRESDHVIGRTAPMKIYSTDERPDKTDTGSEDSRQKGILTKPTTRDLRSVFAITSISFDEERMRRPRHNPFRKAYSLSTSDRRRKRSPSVITTAVSKRPSVGDSSPFNLFLRKREPSLGRDVISVAGKASGRVANMVALVCASFILAWCPFFVVIFINTFCDGCNLTYFLNAVIMVAFTKSGTNPVVYALCHVAFRRAYSRVLSSLCLLRKAKHNCHQRG